MKRLTILILTFTLLCALLASCGTSISAEAFDIDRALFRDEFLTAAALKDYSVAESSDLPSEFSAIIRDKAAYDATFTSDAQIEVDFEKQILVVYTYMAVNRREIKVDDVTMNNDVLSIRLKVVDPFRILFFRFFGADTCAPYQRFVVLRLDKPETLEYVNVNLYHE